MCGQAPCAEDVCFKAHCARVLVVPQCAVGFMSKILLLHLFCSMFFITSTRCSSVFAEFHLGCKHMCAVAWKRKKLVVLDL